MDCNNNDKKIINITGQSNRYQIKKLTQEKKTDKKRVEIEKLNVLEEYFIFEKQLEILKNILNTEEDEKTSKIMLKQIEKKIYSYKQQDIDKKILNDEKLVDIKYIIEKLIETEIKCYYCKCEMYILYQNVRDLKQWTVDRINNDYGHNNDNIVLACLDCNLKRRRKSADKFLFTKQLILLNKTIKFVSNIYKI